MRSLATAPFSVAGPVLLPLLDSRQPQEVQVAAVQTLSRFRDEVVAQSLVDAWRGFTPKVRSEAAEAIFARSERLTVSLQCIGSGQDPTPPTRPGAHAISVTAPESAVFVAPTDGRVDPRTVMILLGR